ncbi:DUF3667 domain-containing protein [Chondrinema litorale]|uniref:DUF3667 domain-containing protein n=1 Tax=Chondrinema litorale TaxID=2994555 RepID=UPI0025435130|nr:DUF3667 domain-containing protein [Chondrinema litorale]UZR97703.1 DUF3667 domain-containing protein [Chondrinema litorale]
MTEVKQTAFCNHCKCEVKGNFCPNCGNPRKLKRINSQYILSEIASVFNFHKGILYTIKELLLRPGKSIQSFIHEDRKRLVKPIIFILICSLTYTLSQQYFQFEDGYITARGLEESTTTKILEWIQKNYGYANILMAVFIAFWTKILFRKHNYNFFEVLILLCFVMGIAMLIYSVFGIFESISHLKVLPFGSFIGFIYLSWAIGQFFDKSKKLNYFKAFLSYILGMLSAIFLTIATGILIDILIKK